MSTVHSTGTTELHKLFSAQQTWITQSMRGSSSPFLMIKKCIGRVLCSIENFCRTQQITRYMCIHTLAMVLVPSTSIADNWLLPLVKAGMYSEACIVATELAMSKPRSAKTISPSNSFFKIPQFSVKCLSLHYTRKALYMCMYIYVCVCTNVRSYIVHT